ncbi:MAG: orc1/cdc6 family replication initiation protein [Desulfurococcaceae archaeon]|nr:orc1/cdc6 family replication initiation protein [Desulfurococcaceae archaeon]
MSGELDIIDEIIRKRGLASRIFANREVLHPDYVPDTLPHREEEIRKLANILIVSAQGERPSNVLLYGLTGTGKTVVTKYVVKRIVEKASSIGRNLGYAYVNTRKIDTPYKVMASIASSVGLRVPYTGLAISEVYRKYVNALESWGGLHIVILDEIDHFVKRKGDDILYKLLRINEDLVKSKVAIIGITNNLYFVEHLDPRVRSSLGEEEMYFPPYNAEQLYTILKQRAEKAFHPGVVDDAVISYCAALAAREHGDARRALDLLRVAGEIAERESAQVVSVEHVKKALVEIEEGRIHQSIISLPLQQKLVLKVAVELASKKGYTTTGEVYSSYVEEARKRGLEPLSMRSVSQILSQLDMMGLILAEVKSLGKHGLTKIIRVKDDVINVVKKVLADV